MRHIVHLGHLRHLGHIGHIVQLVHMDTPGYKIKITVVSKNYNLG